jgi:hypothetical protein
MHCACPDLVDAADVSAQGAKTGLARCGVQAVADRRKAQSEPRAQEKIDRTRCEDEVAIRYIPISHVVRCIHAMTPKDLPGPAHQRGNEGKRDAEDFREHPDGELADRVASIRSCRHMLVSPPSMAIAAPVMKAAASEARYATSSAISSGLP